MSDAGRQPMKQLWAWLKDVARALSVKGAVIGVTTLLGTVSASVILRSWLSEAIYAPRWVFLLLLVAGLGLAV